MTDIITLDLDAKKKILDSLDSISKCVEITLKDHTVLIQKEVGQVISTKDPQVIIEALKGEDPLENFGGELLFECGKKTKDQVGEGESIAIVLAVAFIKEGLKASDALKIKNELECVVPKFMKGLEGSKVKGAYQERCVLLDEGYVSPYFVTHPESMSVEFTAPKLFITKKRLKESSDVVPMLEKGGSVVIISEKIVKDALATLVVNALKQGAQVVALEVESVDEVSKKLRLEKEVYKELKKCTITKESATIVFEENVDLVSVSKLHSQVATLLKKEGVGFKIIQEGLKLFIEESFREDVLKEAVLNALFVASTFLTIETLVIQKKKPSN